MSRLHSVSPQMYLYLVRSGLGYNSGLKHRRQRYLCTTQGNSTFVSWFKRGSFDTTTKMSMQSFDTFVREFVCIDDKHRLKVGEPGYPVAAAERGKRLLVRAVLNNF